MVTCPRRDHQNPEVGAGDSVVAWSGHAPLDRYWPLACRCQVNQELDVGKHNQLVANVLFLHNVQRVTRVLDDLQALPRLRKFLAARCHAGESTLATSGNTNSILTGALSRLLTN